MKDSIILHHEDGSQEEFVGGKDFVEAVARASSAEELRRILNAGGVSGFSEEALEESYRSLALSQNWDAVWEMFQDKDFESCREKLAAHGMDTTRENFDLINEVIATGSDEALIGPFVKNSDGCGSLDKFPPQDYTLPVHGRRCAHSGGAGPDKMVG